MIVDNYQGGRLAAEFLYGRGFRNPGFVGEAARQTYAIPATELRLKGFCDWFAEKNIAVDKKNIWLGEFTEGKADAGIRATIIRADRPDCVFSSSDLIAIRLMRIAVENGIQINRELGLIGFDDLDISEYLNLATVSQSLDESGRLAAEMVLDRLRDPERASRKAIVPLNIMNRGYIGA